MFTSADISQAAMSQNSMFQGMQAQSYSISGQIGSPMPPMQSVPFSYGMADPYGVQSAARWGVGGVSGMNAAVGGLATAGALAGGFQMFGRAGGLMDPFTGVMRGFGWGGRAAAGMTEGAGMFMGGGWTGLKAAHAAGNLGKFALGGVAGAAAAALPYYAIGSAASFVGRNLVQGAQQDYAIQQTMTRNFDFYNPESRTGRGFSPRQIDTISDTIRGISEKDPFTDMGQMTRILARVGQSGALRGTTDAQQFANKFKQLTNTLKDTAKILGTSMEEAFDFFEASKRMGFYNKSEIMRNAVNTVTQAGGGLSARGISTAMAQGAQTAWSQGGPMQAGAELARKTVTQARDMYMSGLVSEGRMREMTGGMGATEAGYQFIGREMQGAAYSLAQSGVGRALYAAIGEKKDGKYTGKLDQAQLQKFLSGQMSSGDVHGLASKKLMSAGLETKASFMNIEKELAGQFASEAGPQGWMGVIDIVKKMRPGMGEEAVKLLLNRMTGMSRHAIEYIMTLYEKQDEMNLKKIQQTTDLLRKKQEDAYMSMNYTFEGLKRQVVHGIHSVTTAPLQRAGAGISRVFRNAAQGLRDWAFGRTQSAQLTQQNVDTLFDVAMGGGRQSAATQQYLGGLQAGMDQVGGFKGVLGGATLAFEGRQAKDLRAGLGGMLDLARGEGATIQGVEDWTGGGSGVGFGDTQKTQFSRQKLGAMIGLLQQANSGSAGFFKDHAEAVQLIRRGLLDNTGKDLVRISKIEGDKTESAQIRRLNELGTLSHKQSLTEVQKHKVNALYQAAMRQVDAVNKDAPWDQKARMAQQIVMRHVAQGEEHLNKIVDIENDPLSGFKGDIMNAQAMASHREKLEKGFADEFADQMRTETSGGIGGWLERAGIAGGASLGGGALMKWGLGTALAGGPIGWAVGGAMMVAGAALTGYGIYKGLVQSPAEVSEFSEIAKDPAKMEEIRKAIASGSIAGAFTKYETGSPMRKAMERIAQMSPEQRQKLLTAAGKVDTARFMEGYGVAAKQYREIGTGLYGLSQKDFETAGLGELGAGVIGLGKRMREDLEAGARSGDPLGAYRGVRDEQLRIAEQVGEALDTGKAAKVRALLSKGGVGGYQLLAGAQVFRKREAGQIEKAMIEAGGADKFVAMMEGQGYKMDDKLRTTLKERYQEGDISGVQRALFLRKTQEKPESATAILGKLDKGIEKLNTTMGKQLDVLLLGLPDAKRKEWIARNVPQDGATKQRGRTTASSGTNPNPAPGKPA